METMQQITNHSPTLESGLQKNIAEHQNKRKEQLTYLLSQACALQKAYGKTASEIETLVEGFNFILEDYVFQEIKDAMMVYIKTQHDVPAPSDLIKIMNEKRRLDNIDNIGISTETLVQYARKGIPLTTAQKRRLIEMSIMDEDGSLKL